LAGLQRLRERGFFEETEEMQETMHAVRRDGNACAGMVEDLVEFDADTMVSSSNFNAAFEVWWDDTHGEETKRPSPESVGRALSMLDERIAVDNAKLRYNGKRYYAGLKLNDDGLAAWEQYNPGIMMRRSNHRIDDNVSEVNRKIPGEWSDKALIKKMRKASGWLSSHSPKKPKK
jgi:hypothetical protein